MLVPGAYFSGASLLRVHPCSPDVLAPVAAGPWLKKLARQLNNHQSESRGMIGKGIIPLPIIPLPPSHPFASIDSIPGYPEGCRNPFRVELFWTLTQGSSFLATLG